MLFIWWDGSLQAEEHLPIIIFNAVLPAFVPASIHFLDNQAVNALNYMKPVLDTSESEFDQYEYEFSNMPPARAHNELMEYLEEHPELKT